MITYPFLFKIMPSFANIMGVILLMYMQMAMQKQGDPSLVGREGNLSLHEGKVAFQITVEARHRTIKLEKHLVLMG